VQLYCDISEDNLASLNLFKSQNFNILGKKEAWQKVGTIYKGVFMLQKLNPNRKF
jgi:diamine N-acetyltransferase